MDDIELLDIADVIRMLLDEGRAQGYLTLDRVLEALPDAESEIVALDDLFAALHQEGIAVYGDESDLERVREGAVAGASGGASSDEAMAPRSIEVDDSISLYFGDIRTGPLLTKEQEIELARQVMEGQEAAAELAANGHNRGESARFKLSIVQGREARKELIERNTRLVINVAKRYRGYGLPFGDLIQAGNEGLIKSVDRFDYRRGNRFSTYAFWWIRQAVTRTLADQRATIRIPVHTSDRIRRLLRKAQEMEQRMGRRPTSEELAADVEGLDANQADWMMKVWQQPVSLDGPVGANGDAEFGDLIEDQTSPAPDEVAERGGLRLQLERVLQSLTAREARTLRLRYGLDGQRPHTLEEVGRKLGVSRERARQIERAALRKLRHPRHSRDLMGYRV
ncbi:MAG: sigma-70 family RNA polymerase sigma factor [Anaerolineales bacterium]|nr:MAG: sigma-70 family RNA polymerase sigma factor [Anaerolineales bacterium]